MKENVLVHGVCTQIGDFLGLTPALIELSKSYNVFLDTPPKLDSLIELLKPNNIQRVQGDINFNRHIHVNLQGAFLRSIPPNWHMTQSFMHQIGFTVPLTPIKTQLSFPIIPTFLYDFLISPFARSIPTDEKWQQEKWQYLVNKLPDKRFALLGDSSVDNKNYVSGKNVDTVFDSSFQVLCNLFKNCRCLISVVTGTSHLAYHLSVRNILLNNQNKAWGVNPEALKIHKRVINISVDEVLAIINLIPPLLHDFDEKYYLSKYEDVADAIRLKNNPKNGFEHFWTHGFKEGRDFKWKLKNNRKSSSIEKLLIL